MSNIPASTPNADAVAAQTHRADPVAARTRTVSTSVIGYRFGERLLPREKAPTRKPRHKSDPLYRPLHIYALDPTQPKLDGRVAVVNVPWEPLEPGPIGWLFEVENADPTRGGKPEPLDLDATALLLERGVRPTTSDGRFHRQMVYAVCSSVYNAFYHALGRDLTWGFQHRDRLCLRPFALPETRNAFYDPNAGELRFGYFTIDYSPTAADTVYTSLSHDIIAHELTHALLDGLRRHFTIPTNPDVFAFHEAFGDIVAIFHHFSYPEIVRVAIRDSGGKLDQQTILSGIARQFGEGVGKGGVLRTAIDFTEGVPKTKYGDVHEPHDRGAVLVAAVFDTYTRVFRRKAARLIRLATGGTGELGAGHLPHDLLMALADEASKIATQFLEICIRAIDYCPPVDITFGEFLRAVITADRDLVPDDPWAYREAWLDAFRLRQIFPDNVHHLSEDAIEWRPPKKPVRIPQLNFASLQFAGDPAHAVSKQEAARQATALGDEICRRDRLEEFGLIAPDDEALKGDAVDLPRIESIRSSRRVGPDGQIAFDLVAEVTQCRYVHHEGSVHPVYGGSTIIIGPDGDVRYVVGKSVRKQARIDAQLAFVASGNRFWTETDGRLTPTDKPFQLLHDRGFEE